MKILGICGTNKRGNKKSDSEWFLKKALEAVEELGAYKFVLLLGYRP